MKKSKIMILKYNYKKISIFLLLFLFDCNIMLMAFDKIKEGLNNLFLINII